jgi:Sulfotransferase family
VISRVKNAIKSISNIHRPNGEPNVFLFSTPRSGSTWLMELIWSQPGFKCCNEPLNLRKPHIRQHLGISDWQGLCRQDATQAFYRYFRAIGEGRITFVNPNPLHRYYRPVTRRIVFKIIHGGEDRINWFRDTFNGRIVYLLRHPIPVSLSREVYPTLEAFCDSDYRRHFTADQLQYARKIIDSGTKLERGVLAWCLQNAVPLREVSQDWAVISYEQLVLDPHPVIEHLALKLSLPKPERMMNRLAIPSSSNEKSDRETQQVLERETERRSWLIEKWRQKVDQVEERGAMDVLKRFNLDAYEFGHGLPADWLWIKPATAKSPWANSPSENHKHSSS